MSTGLSEVHAKLVVRDHIDLEDWESKIFDTLLETCEHHGLSTVLRCAGGWVRDKLLDRASHDIDIALDNMTGSAFALKVNEYLTSQMGLASGEAATVARQIALCESLNAVRHNRPQGLETRSIGVIAANPEQSKHLETATLRINDVSVDLVNLRSETYSDGSRIPEMVMGTPLQDAERRDFTINSLFYNLNQRTVEDFTGRGLQDLRDGIIRTPLDPETTFLDDPLRVLRAVRFASRYQFMMVDELVASARTDKVREALERKIARERVGVELAGMLQGPHPLLAMEHLQALQLFPAVFTPPDNLRKRLGPDFGAVCVAVLRAGLEVLNETQVTADGKQNDELKRLACLVALLLPLRRLSVPLKKGKTQPLTQHIVREAIKWRAKDGDSTVLMHQEMETLSLLHSRLLQDASEPDHQKTQLGHSLRRLRELSPLALELFPLLALPDSVPLASDSPEDPVVPVIDSCTLDVMKEQSARVRAAMERWQLTACHEWAPLVKGAEIQAAVGMDKPGPLLGQLTAAAVDWQLLNPEVKRGPSDPVPAGLLERLQAEYQKISQR